MPHGSSNVLRLLTFSNPRHPSGLLIYIMGDLIAFFATGEAHVQLLEKMFQAPQAVRPTLKPSKVQSGPKRCQIWGMCCRLHRTLGRPQSTDRHKGKALGNVHDQLVREFIPNLATVIEPLVVLS